MARGGKALLAALWLAAGCAPARVAELPLPEGKMWAQNPNLPPGGEFVVVAGTPAAAGIYAFRVRFPAGLRVMPHSHPDDRIYTIFAGHWTIGLGTTFDGTKLQRFGPGEVYRLPANTPHYHLAEADGAVFQVSGVGPTATVFVRPEDDPRRR